jgi:hypothetical protein
MSIATAINDGDMDYEPHLARSARRDSKVQRGLDDSQAAKAQKNAIITIATNCMHAPYFAPLVVETLDQALAEAPTLPHGAPLRNTTMGLDVASAKRHPRDPSGLGRIPIPCNHPLLDPCR